MAEAEWLDALRAGNLDWFPELVQAYQHRIYALAYRKTSNAADAEDLAQEIFLQFYRKLPLFRGDAALSTWLYRVALNRAASYRRTNWREERQNESWEPEAPPDDEQADTRLLNAERRQAVLSAMAKLRTHEREVLELFYFQRHSTARLAEILGLAPRGVETRLRRARARMKKLLGETGYFEEVDADGNARKRLLGEMAAKLS